MAFSERARAAIEGVWLRSRDRMFERVALLETAAASLLDGPLPPALREQAERAAHQLAGTCGTFGFTEATDLAREAERALAGEAPVAPATVYRLAEIALAIHAQLSAGLPAREAEAASAPAPDEGELLLALDDDAEMLALLSALLVPAGFRVMATTDPEMFLELLASQEPAMVLLDVDMPRANGVEMCGRLRADPRWAALPILFLTARTDAESVATLFDAGADDYAAKPVTGPELVARVRNRLARIRVRRAATLQSAPTTDVVIVDDDRVLVGLLEQSLGTGGYSVAAYRDGATALAALVPPDGRAMPEVRPRVIVLDVGLPGMDGLTVLRALARQGITKRSRVVMLTARTSEEEVMRALELGAFDHVAKPFSVPILLQRIRRAFDAAGAP